MECSKRVGSSLQSVAGPDYRGDSLGIQKNYCDFSAGVKRKERACGINHSLSSLSHDSIVRTAITISPSGP